MTTLTPRQRAILYFIKGFTDDYHYPPCVHEIAFGIGANSKTAVSYQLDQLQKLGFMTRGSRRWSSRMITLTEQPTRIPA